MNHRDETGRREEEKGKRRERDRKEKREDTQDRVILYADGACRGNPGVGAYGVVLVGDGFYKELKKSVPRTTNNRMELSGVIAGFESLRELTKDGRRRAVHVVTDSQYVVKGMTEWLENWRKRGWKTSGRKDVLNRDLWEKLVEVSGDHDVTWEWIRGHAGHPENERCDELANEAMDGQAPE